MAGPTPQPGIMNIRLYESGKAAIAGKAQVLKLSANESPFGCSPEVAPALAAAAEGLERYPGTDHAALRAAIGEIHGLDPAQIICGVGSDEVLQFIAQSFAGVGDEVIYTEHGFSMYPLLAQAVGAIPVKVREKQRRVDCEAILAAVTPRTRIVFLANPANPTSTFLERAEVAGLAAALPESCLLVLDGAYAEFVEGFDGGADLVETHDNVIMTRTFSKIYGLGGLRVGWGYGPREIVDVLNRVRQPFNLSNLQLAAAEAAVRDQVFVAASRAKTIENRIWMAQELSAIGLPSDESFANFILPRFADAETALAADSWLRNDGIIVRMVPGYGLPEALRITVGSREDCTRVVQSLTAFQEGRG